MWAGFLWPAQLIQLNLSFTLGEPIDALAEAGVLHQECRRIFHRDKEKHNAVNAGTSLRLQRHHSEAIRIATAGHHHLRDRVSPSNQERPI
jgi:hypothetical protein